MAAADLFGSDLDSDDDGEKGSASESDESEQIASPQNPSVASSPAPEKEDQGSRSGSGSRNSSVSSRSGSATPASSRHSSPAQRSRSPSPNNAASHHSGSPRTSRSQSPEETHSQSPKETHSQSPKANRSQSPVNADDRSQTPSGRSRSASPASNASNSPGNRPAKPRKILSSGDDSRSSNGEKETAENVNDLFGDADDLESDEEKADKRSKIDDDENDEERGENKEEHEGEEKEEAEPEPEKRIEVDIPRINPDLGRHIHFVKMPNFLSVETRPFDPKFYEDEIIEDEVMDEEGRTRLKLKVENTVRWRYAMDKEGNIMTDDMGQSMKESNARVVRWSDGSMSLHLGNEIFDIHQMPLQGDFNHLFIRQGTGLQGQAVFKTKLTFRPHSTDSFTHRKVTMSMADRTMKKAHNVKVLPIIGKDPDAQRNEMIKKEEERLRASVRRESQQRRIREKAYQRGINASYLEGDDDDDENAISLSAIKKQFKGGKQPQRSNIYTSESEDSLSSLSDDEPGKRKIPTRAKKIDSNEDDSDAEVKVKKARVVESDSEASDEGKKGSAAAASMDSDDDDDDD